MRRTAARGLSILVLGALAADAPAVVVTGDAPIVETQTAKTATNLSPEVFERLPGTRDVRDILLLVPGVVGGQKVDEVKVGLGKSVGGKATPTTDLTGIVWTKWKDGYIAGKPGVMIDGNYVSGGFQLPIDVKLPEKIEIQLGGGGKPLYGGSVPVRPLNPPIRLTDPKGAIQLPQSIQPGSSIWFRPRDPKYTPGGGEWKIGPLTPKWNGSFDSPGYKLQIPLDYKIGSGLKIGYRDPWGKTLVDGYATGVALGPPATGAAGGQPAVTGCSSATLAGDTFCLCGNFPEGSAADLLINGQSIGQYLVSSSPTIVNVDLPADFPAGALDVTAGASSGFDIVDGTRGVLIHVGGEVDRNRLKRGQSTSLKLWLDGTTLPTNLRLRNLTPGIVALEGGNDQVVTTSGGQPNQVQRRVDAVSVGDFNLQYELTVGSCPCADDVAQADGDDGEDRYTEGAGDTVETGQDMGERAGDDDEDEILDRWVTQPEPKKDLGETGVEDDGEDNDDPGDQDDPFSDFGPQYDPNIPDDPLWEVSTWQWRNDVDEWERRARNSACRDEEVAAWLREIQRQRLELDKTLSGVKGEIAKLAAEIPKLPKDSTIAHRHHVEKYMRLVEILARLGEVAKALAALKPCEYLDTKVDTPSLPTTEVFDKPPTKEECKSRGRDCDELRKKMIELEARARELRRRAEHPDESQLRADRDAERLEREAAQDEAQVEKLLQQAKALRDLEKQALDTAAVASASARANPKSDGAAAAAKARADAASWAEQAKRLEEEALAKEKSAWAKRAAADSLRAPKGAGDRAAAEAERIARDARQAWLDCLGELKGCESDKTTKVVELPPLAPPGGVIELDDFPPGGKIVEIGPIARGGKATDEETKEKKICGPDVTKAFEGALRRMADRVRRLPAGETGPDDGFDFLWHNWPWKWSPPAADNPSIDPPTPAKSEDVGDWADLIEWSDLISKFGGCGAEMPCLDTSWLWGRCLPTALVVRGFEQYVRGIFGATSWFGDLGAPEVGGGSIVFNTLATPGTAMGVGVRTYQGGPESALDDVEFRKLTRDVWEAAFDKLFATLKPPCLDCLACRMVIEEFPDDFSREDWELSDGSWQRPDGTIVKPPQQHQAF